jgi:hypothetical protein
MVTIENPVGVAEPPSRFAESLAGASGGTATSGACAASASDESDESEEVASSGPMEPASDGDGEASDELHAVTPRPAASIASTDMSERVVARRRVVDM